ncbi:MAG: ROK family protein [Roseobacter sp.]
MVLVLADVGGTNVRFACVEEGGTAPTNVKRYQNDHYVQFDDAYNAYVTATGIERATALSVAVAGPVTGTNARLTNRDWSLDVEEIAKRHSLSDVFLLNDLSALGYALDALDEVGLASISGAPDAVHPADQRLVIGVGTGFNVSPVLKVGPMTVCLRAEAGLGSLPGRVARVLERYIGGPAAWVRCAEDAVRGPGLSKLHAAASGKEPVDARDIIHAAREGNAQALASVTVYAEMLGELVQDLRLLYMPQGGIYLAGSVVRGLLGSPARAKFIETLDAQPSVKSTLAPVPVSLITQDEAALLGCLSFARIMGAGAT